MSQSSGLGQFTRLPSAPSDVSQAGSTVEELKLQAGTPDPNPVVSPMLAPEVRAQALAQIGSRLEGSDNTRLSTPPTPTFQDPSQVFHYRLVDAFSAIKKLDASAVGDVMRIVNDAVKDPVVQRLMGDSGARVDAMTDKLRMFTDWAAQVDVKRLSRTKG